MTSGDHSFEQAPRRRSRWTDALLVVCGLFVLTVFLMLASALNPNAGLLTRLFDRHGITMLLVEVGAILVVAIMMLVAGRRETRRRTRGREALLEAGPLDPESREPNPSAFEPPSF